MRDLYSLISKMDSIQNEDMDIDRLSLDIDGDVMEMLNKLFNAQYGPGMYKDFVVTASKDED
jgi:hypothetical protein|tara:strand:+ start:593 stop:778 length:186 start_codon:yes stop_codon:yes gene_type:complete